MIQYKKMRGEPKLKILMIIPAYNEEGNIIKVLEGLQRYKKYDVIVVDDCSKDNTFMMVKKYIYNHRDHNVNPLSFFLKYTQFSAAFP